MVFLEIFFNLYFFIFSEQKFYKNPHQFKNEQKKQKTELKGKKRI